MVNRHRLRCRLHPACTGTWGSVAAAMVMLPLALFIPMLWLAVLITVLMVALSTLLGAGHALGHGLF